MAARRVCQAPAGIDYLINVAFGEFTVPVKFFRHVHPRLVLPVEERGAAAGCGNPVFNPSI